MFDGLKFFLQKLFSSKFIVGGKCKMCGTCCRNIVFYIGKKIISDEKEFEKAVAIDADNPSLLIKTGNCYKQQNQNEKALAYYQKALALNEKNTDAMFNIGLCYTEMPDKTAEAIDAFQKVIALDANYTFAYYALAISYEKNSQYKEALENYEKFAELSPDKNVKNSLKTRINNLKKKLPQE